MTNRDRLDVLNREFFDREAADKRALLDRQMPATARYLQKADYRQSNDWLLRRALQESTCDLSDTEWDEMGDGAGLMTETDSLDEASEHELESVSPLSPEDLTASQEWRNTVMRELHRHVSDRDFSIWYDTMCEGRGSREVGAAYGLSNVGAWKRALYVQDVLGTVIAAFS